MRADYLAAVLACGTGAALSHRPAAYVLRLLPGPPPPPEVTVPTTAGRQRPGIVVHRVKALDRRDLEVLDARRRRSSHLAYSYGDVFERGTSTIAELRRRLRQRG